MIKFAVKSDSVFVIIYQYVDDELAGYEVYAKKISKGEKTVADIKSSNLLRRKRESLNVSVSLFGSRKFVYLCWFFGS